MEAKMKFFYPRVKAVDIDARRITVCISKDEIDRHNERIEISAIADALKGYAVNPVVLGDHQHRLSSGKSSVIGHAPPESFKALDNEVDMDIVFSVTENAESYWINYRDGHQKAVSIGFIDLEWRFEEEGNRKIYVTTKLELLELSCVAVGGNRGALIKAKGMFDKEASLDNNKIITEAKNTLVQALLDVWQDEMKNLADRFNQLKNAMGQDFDKIQQALDDIKSILIADSDRFADELLLGGPSGPPVPAGDNNAEQSFERMEKVLQFGDTKNVDK